MIPTRRRSALSGCLARAVAAVASAAGPLDATHAATSTPSPVNFTGGNGVTLEVVGAMCRLTFTSNGTLEVPAGVTAADVLLVGGGGGSSLSGAGGGGQVVVLFGVAFAPGIVTDVVTGSGGSPGTTGVPASPGGVSSLSIPNTAFVLTAVGGAPVSANGVGGGGAPGGPGMVVVQFTPGSSSTTTTTSAAPMSPVTVTPTAGGRSQITARLRFIQAGRYTLYVQTAAGRRITLQAGSFFGNTTLTKAGRSNVKAGIRRGGGVVFGAVVARPPRKGSIVRLALRRPNGTLVAQSFPLQARHE